MHRNINQHGEVTAALLCSLCGTVIRILEVSLDGWIDQENVDSLRSVAESGLKVVRSAIPRPSATNRGQSDRRESGYLHKELWGSREKADKLSEELKEERGKLEELRRSSKTASGICDLLQNSQKELGRFSMQKWKEYAMR